MKRILHKAIITAAAGLAGCIVEFNPTLSTDAMDILVVEGTVTDGETVIMLHWSESLKTSVQDYYREPKPASGATIRVESEAGGSFSSTEIFEDKQVLNEWGFVETRSVSTGRYVITNGALDDNTRYRVRIDFGGEEYVSGWRTAQKTPPIEDVDFHVEDHMVQVRVDVTGEADEARNYLWNYEETWETRARINASHYFGMWEGDYGDTRYTLDDYLKGRGLTMWAYPNFRSPFFHCWKYANSQQLLIADTKRLSENSLRDHVLFEFETYNDRLSVLYHIKLRQYAIGDDAYYYLNTLKENTDNTGSIFAPIPSEMKGNIVCSTSPEVYVIGFVEVSHVDEIELFMDSVGSPYAPLPNLCREIDLETKDPVTNAPVITEYNASSFYLVQGYNNDIRGATFSDLGCIDCRATGGTKRRPSWWPNSNY